MRQLRDYQIESDQNVHTEWSEGRTRTLVVLATGLGKTDVIAKVATDAVHERKRVLVLAHRSELLDQITKRCAMHDPTIPVGRVQAQRNETRRPITVAMAPTLASAKRRARLPKPDVVIVDEAHHAASKSQMAILEWAGCFDEVNPTPAMGVTATPSRGDKRKLGDVWQSPAIVRDIAWAITHGPSVGDPLVTAPVGAGADAGWLVRPHGRVVVASHMDLNAAKISKGDYQDNELGEMVSQDVTEIVKAWLEHASDRLTIAFTPNVASAQALAEEFRAQGVPTGEVYGSTSLAERGSAEQGTGIYGRLARGELRVLISVMVTTEGWDCPPVSCVLMARPTRLQGLYQQCVGRGLRTSPETGKADCLVLDVVGASRTQRLVTLVDLHPSATYNTDELDLVPCETCGGYLGPRSSVELAALAEQAGMVACSCPCESCGELPCACPPAARDPEGGRRRLQGPATYEAVDLLGLSSSPLRWLATRAGVPFAVVGEPKHPTRPQRYVVLWADPGDRYAAGHVDTRGRDGRWLDDHVPHNLEEARALAERWALEYDPQAATRGQEPWRRARKSGSEKQQDLARRLGVEHPEAYTSGGLSDAIDVALASRVLDRIA